MSELIVSLQAIEGSSGVDATSSSASSAKGSSPDAALLSAVRASDGPALRRALVDQTWRKLPLVVDSVLRCCVEGTAAPAKVAEVFRAVIALTEDGRLRGTDAKSCVHALQAHASKLDALQREALLDVIVAGFARHAEDAGSEYEGEALELLPILLSPSDGGVAADDAVASAVQARTLAQVVDAKWPAHLSIHVATVSLYLFFVSNI